jgi:TetR/AcrR family transcriptional regulator, cholesterol catabolism regulator
MKQRRGERWLTRRTEIVDIAAQVFAKHGYHGTSLAQLCSATKLGRGALYHYIESKENLVALIHDRVLDEVLDDGKEVTRIEASASAKLEELGARLIKTICKYPNHVWVFLHEYQVLTGNSAHRFHTQRRLYEDYVQEILVQGIDSGEFAIDDVRLTTLAWLGMHNYTYIWLHSEPEADPVVISGQFSKAFLVGIQSRSVYGGKASRNQPEKNQRRLAAAQQSIRAH